MIDVKKYLLYDFLNKKASKKFSEKGTEFFGDLRIKEVFKNIYKQGESIDKYYFTKSTMIRIDKLDISKIHPENLSYLYIKNKDELGFVFCEDKKLCFIYLIGINDIKIICTTGSLKESTPFRDSFGRLDNSPLNKSIIGSIILSYKLNTFESISNDLISNVFNKKDFIKNSDINRLKKSIEKTKWGAGGKEVITINDDPFLFYKIQEMHTKNDLLFKCLKMFIFLKTAEYNSKDFISEDNENRKYTAGSKIDYKIIDSTWDTNINVLNPFGVSGHFRNQPKKNENKDWYKELIYIDSFTKNGYKRQAGILKT